jgi:hypothetical protein
MQSQNELSIWWILHIKKAIYVYYNKWINNYYWLIILNTDGLNRIMFLIRWGN